MTDEEYNKVKLENKRLLDSSLKDKNFINIPTKCKEEEIILSDDSGNLFRLILENGRRKNKYKFQIMSKNNSIILCRIDTSGPDYYNPGSDIPVPYPHIHIYKQGFRDSFAYTLESLDEFSGCENECSMLKNLLNYFNVNNVGRIINSNPHIF